MKLQTELNADILQIKQNIWLGLNLRQLIFGGLGVGLAGVSYIMLVNKLGQQPTSWISIGIAFVFIFFGFFSFNGLPAEKLIVAIYKDLNNPLQISADLNNFNYRKIKQKKKRKETVISETAENSKSDGKENDSAAPAAS